MSDAPIFDPSQFQKPDLRKEIDAKREIYLREGGMIRKYMTPIHEDNYLVCDGFKPGEGATMSALGLKDTKVRKPRPEKKFAKKQPS